MHFDCDEIMFGRYFITVVKSQMRQIGELTGQEIGVVLAQSGWLGKPPIACVVL